MNNLQVRVCILTEIVSGRAGEAHNLGIIQRHAEGDEAEHRQTKLEELTAEIVMTEFRGTAISDSGALRNAAKSAIEAGFPDAELLVIGPADGLPEEELRAAFERAVAVKQLLIELGVHDENVAADMPVRVTVEPLRATAEA
jgi:hypothetical protein